MVILHANFFQGKFLKDSMKQDQNFQWGELRGLQTKTPCVE